LSAMDDIVEVQDAGREILMCAKYGITRYEGKNKRHNWYDGTKHGFYFQCKSTITSGVPTSHETSATVVDKWLLQYWVCTKGRNLRAGFVDDETWILHPEQLRPWVKDRVWSVQISDEAIINAVMPILEKSGMATHMIERLRYLANHGVALNCPKLPMKHIRNFGTRIYSADDLDEFVFANPITQEYPKVANPTLEFLMQ
jgi:hypothetical protein